MSNPLVHDFFREELVKAHKRYAPLRLPYDSAMSDFLDLFWETFIRMTACVALFATIEWIMLNYIFQYDDLLWFAKGHPCSCVGIGVGIILDAVFVANFLPSFRLFQALNARFKVFKIYRHSHNEAKREYNSARALANRSFKEQGGVNG